MPRWLPYPMGIIPGKLHPAEPVYWNWAPPTEAEWEWARTDRRYGTACDDDETAFRVLVRWCRYRCGICGESSEDRRIVMDHDHKTSWCRGLLCDYHNRVEGLGHGGVFSLYRQRPPALICGVKVEYSPASVLPASPELLQFQLDLYAGKWAGDRPDCRWRLPWTAAELGIASRDDLTDAEVAGITGRRESQVAWRRRKLTLGPPDLDAWL